MNERTISWLGERAGLIGARVGIVLFATIAIGQVASGDFTPLPVWALVLGVLLVLASACGALFLQNAATLRRLPSSAMGITLLILFLTMLEVALTGAWSMLALPVACVLFMGWRALYQAIALVTLAIFGFLALARLNGGFDMRLAVLVLIAAGSGFVIHSMTKLVAVVDELKVTRERLARLEVDQERARISRDLHDILGRTLVAVALRNETALRLLGLDEDACRSQLLELQSTVIGGQAQLRTLTSGPTLVGLGSELASARNLLDRLQVRLSIDAVEVEDLAINQAFAAVVREAVTNMLKHSRPTMCRIGIRRESLALVATIVNDQALPQNSNSAGGQTGLLDLESCIASLGGTLTAGPFSRGRYRVIARVPTNEVGIHGDTGSEPNPIRERRGESVPVSAEPGRTRGDSSCASA